MKHQLAIELTPAHVKYAVRKFFLKNARRPAVALVVLTALVVVLRIEDPKLGRFADLLTGFADLMTMVIVVFVLLILMLYFFALKQRLLRLKRYGGKVQYEFSEDSFRSKSGWASLEIKWEIFKSLSVYPLALELWSPETGFFTLPTEQTSDEIKEFLKRKVVSAGGKIS